MKKLPLASVLSEQPRNGWSPPAEYQTGTGVPVLTLSSVTGFEYDGTRTKLTSAPSKDGAHYWLQAGELLITRSNTEDLVGHVAVYDGFPANAICCDLIMKMKVDPAKALTRYIYYFLRSPESRKYLSSRAQGASPTMKKIGKQVVQNIPVPVPPLAEQQRIVGLLDEAFEGLATAKANAEKNLQNARALFESHLQSVFTQRGEGWMETTIEEVCIIGDGNHSSNYPRKEELVESGVPFIRATNMVAGRISGNEMRFLSPQKHAQLKKGHLKTGDILITNRGEIGKTAIVDEDYDNANLNSQIAWLRCRNGMDNRFLFHVLNSGDIQQHFESSKSGAALQQFTIRQLKALKVPSPPKLQQESIVNQLDALSEETQRLATIYDRKLAAVDDLKKSLLHQAFSGNL